MADSFDSFAVIKFFQQLGSPADQINASWAPFSGRHSSVETFYVEGTPQPGAYILLQLYNATSGRQGILINGDLIPKVDIPPLAANGWSTWMDVFSSPVLKSGPNTIQIVSGDLTGSNFILGSLVIHWMQTRG
jgi:hypothetical protein